ncbi:SDR family NAD(P)-dependent oxidoreductase [bacterium]|nr:SDR family NAD(P)-dependent oxidoreductase [bacterium]
MRLSGKKVAITGGRGGIGSHITQMAFKRGAMPIVIDRSAPPAGVPWPHIQGDLSSVESVGRIAQQLAELKPDILINLAGIQYFGLLEEQSPQQIATMYQVNLISPVLLTQALLPMMKARGSGHIVNVGSIFGSIPFAHFVAYSSTKAGIKGFSQALRRELAGSGIQVTHVAPRAVKTPLNNEKILALASRTRMNMDAPSHVATRMLDAIEQDRKDVYIGFPESFFVRVNALLPQMVDNALAKNDRIAREILTASL